MMWTCVKRLAAVVPCIAGAVLCIAGAIPPAFAWPDKPVRFLVGFQAGGGADIMARALADALREEFKNVRIIIDNRPGNSGERAFEALLAATDDHTFLLYANEFITLPLVKPDARYGTLRDYKPVGLISEGPFIIISGPKAKTATFAEFVAHARANPGKITYATPGSGTQVQLAGQYLSRVLKLGMTHVTSGGSGGATVALIDGKVDMALVGIGAPLRHILADKITALAVTSAKRHPLLAETPTMAEVGLPKLLATQRYGLMAPKSMPDAIVERMSKAMAVVLTDESVRARIEEYGFTVKPTTPQEYEAHLRETIEKWQGLIAEEKLTLE